VTLWYITILSYFHAKFDFFHAWERGDLSSNLSTLLFSLQLLSSPTSISTMASRDFNNTVELAVSIRHPVESTIPHPVESTIPQNDYNDYWGSQQYAESGNPGSSKVILKTENQHLNISYTWPYPLIGCQMRQLRLITATGLTLRRISIKGSTRYNGKHVDTTSVVRQMSIIVSLLTQRDKYFAKS